MGVAMGSPDGIEAMTFRGKNQLTGLTREYKNQFYKCKTVSSSSEKHPWVLVNHNLKQGQQDEPAGHMPVHSGLPQKHRAHIQRPPQHARDTGSRAQLWREPQSPLLERQKDARMLKLH